MTEREREIALLLTPCWKWLLSDDASHLTDAETVRTVDACRDLWRLMCRLDATAQVRRVA